MENTFLSIPINCIWKSEVEVKKSRFLGFAKYVQNEQEAEDFIEEQKNKFKDARHVCFAYSLLNTMRFSDDGEPSGTAGKPMLDLINKLKMKNVVLVIVRYFGGVKLGAGPLLRTYATCAKETLSSDMVKWEKAKKSTIKMSFKDYGTLQNMVTKSKMEIENVIFENDVTLNLILPLQSNISLGNLINEEEIWFNFKEK